MRKILITLTFLFTSLIFSQVLIRNSDQKTVDSVDLLQKGRKISINKENLNNYLFHENDQLLYKEKPVDFYFNNDTLIIFDKVNEIKEVNLISVDFTKKREKKVKSGREKALAEIFPNNRVATFLKVDSEKKTYLKSITLFPEPFFFSKGIIGLLSVDVLPVEDGLPDLESPIVSFNQNVSGSLSKKWEIKLPRIIKIPEEGLYISLFFKTDEKISIVLRLNKDSDMLIYYPQSREWKKMNFNGYQFQLTILQ